MTTAPDAHSDDELVGAVETLQDTPEACATGGVSAASLAAHLDRHASGTQPRLERLVEAGRLTSQWDIGPNGPCITYATADFARKHQVEFPEADHA